MSQLSRGIFGAIAVSLTFGAVQFASGRDLAGVSQIPVAQTAANTPETTAINRVGKTDRAAGAAQTIQTRTISVRVDGLADTSILIRLPVAREARNGPPGPAVVKSGNRRMTVACEPVVSVLTEVAKLLEPGRCVT